MCLILDEEQQNRILEIAMAVNNKLEEGTFYRYDGSKLPQRRFCQTMMGLNKLYTKADINQMSFQGVNGEFAKKGSRNYSIFKYRGGANCKHYWREVEVRLDEDDLPQEYDRGIVDNSPVERLNFSEEKQDNNMEENLFEFIFNEDTMEGVYDLSFVLEPAITVEMMQFANEEKQEWKMSSEEKQLIVSPVMIPNQKVWRNSIGGKSGYVFSTAETIEKLQQNFAKQKYGTGSTFEHDVERPVTGTYVSESWLIEDPINDKANALGFKDLPKGTWMVSMKIDNKEIWEDYIKTGKVKGLSIDALLGAKRINNNDIIKFNMNRKTITDIVEMAIQKVALAAELVEFKISDELSYYASELALESIVTDADGNAVANVEFEFEGFKYKTDGVGAIVEIEAVESPVEDIEVELAVDAEGNSIPEAVDPTIALNDKIAELEAKVAEQASIIADLEAKNVKLEADLVLKESEKVAMSANTPASRGIKDVPTLDNETKIEKGVLSAFRKHSK